MEFNYDVFFSYRHKPLDGVITQKTFNAIESYKLPKPIKAQGFQDVRRAFRDTEELPVSRILTDTIDKALHSTNCLIIVCSTDTPSSEWVDREVATFIEIGRADHIYPLLISGDPDISFPPSLKLVPDIADRVMDIRTDGNDVRKMMAKEETELLKVIAGITGCSLKELTREHKMRKVRRFAARAGAAAAVFAAVAAVSLGLMNRAQNYRDRAQTAEKASMSILQELTYGLPDKLTGVPGAYSKISDILRDNAGQINDIIMLSSDKESAGYEMAANYEKLATALTVLGGYDEASDYQSEAVRLYESLEATEKSAAALASAKNNLGRVLSVSGDFEGAAAAFDEAIRLQRETGSDNTVLIAQMLCNAGANAAESGNYEKALGFFEECTGMLAGQELKDYDMIAVSGEASYNYGVLLQRVGDYSAAAEQLRISLDRYGELCARTDSVQNRNLLAHAASSLAMCLTDEGEHDEAGPYYAQAIEISEQLAEDRENTDVVSSLAELYNNYGLSLNTQGKYSDADEYYRKAAELYDEIRRNSGSAFDTAVYAMARLNLGENGFKAGDYETSRADFEKGLEAFEPVCDELGSYYSSQYHAWKSYYELIHLRDFEAAVNSGITACELQGDNVLANMNLGYACLYAGYYEDCDYLLGAVAALGEGVADTIRNDIAAQEQSGLYSEHTAELLQSCGISF